MSVDLDDGVRRLDVVRGIGGHVGEAAVGSSFMDASCHSRLMPTRNAPLSTVTYSAVGCVCGITL